MFAHLLGSSQEAIFKSNHAETAKLKQQVAELESSIQMHVLEQQRLQNELRVGEEDLDAELDDDNEKDSIADSDMSDGSDKGGQREARERKKLKTQPHHNWFLHKTGVGIDLLVQKRNSNIADMDKTIMMPNEGEIWFCADLPIWSIHFLTSFFFIFVVTKKNQQQQQNKQKSQDSKPIWTLLESLKMVMMTQMWSFITKQQQKHKKIKTNKQTNKKKKQHTNPQTKN